MYTIQSSSSTPGCLPERSKSMCPHKDLYMNVSRSFTCNSQKLGTTQVCTADEQRNCALSVRWTPASGDELTPSETAEAEPRSRARGKTRREVPTAKGRVHEMPGDTDSSLGTAGCCLPRAGQQGGDSEGTLPGSCVS